MKTTMTSDHAKKGDIPFYTPQELAARWKINDGTLANWRSQGTGPKFYKKGGKVILYAHSDVKQYEKWYLKGR